MNSPRTSTPPTEPVVHVYAPAGFRWRRIDRCPRCRRRTRHIVHSWMWFASHFHCCACGATTRDDGLRRKRRYDADNARRWRREWPTLPNRAAFAEWLRAEIDANMG